jgi:hypothetical protein
VVMYGWMDGWGMYTSIPRSSSGSEHQGGWGRRRGGGTKDEDEDVRASERAMAAHQMPTTAPGMPHPSAVIPPQYAHSQPQVSFLCFFFLRKRLRNEQIRSSDV